MSNVSPKAEPIAWATIVALAIGTAASYGFKVTAELKELLVYVLPLVTAAGWARFQVTAPDTLAQETNQAYAEGLHDASQSPDRENAVAGALDALERASKAAACTRTSTPRGGGEGCHASREATRRRGTRGPAGSGW